MNDTKEAKEVVEKVFNFAKGTVLGFIDLAESILNKKEEETDKEDSSSDKE